MSKLEVLITSGGTISKIDDVRHIGNFSKGTTGALIAEEFLRNNAVVHYVYGSGAKRPFRKDLELNLEKSFDKEIERIKEVKEEFDNYKSNLHEYSIETFDDYYGTVKDILTKKPIDVAVLAAAVSDYGAKQAEGKISSDMDTMQLELYKNPKIISLVKEWKPDVFQVGFKLLSGVKIEELIDIAYQHGIKNHSNLTVANTVVEGNFNKRAIVLITPEKGLIPVSASDLASKLVDVVAQRFSRQHYKTQLSVDSGYLKKFEGQISQFRKNVQKLWNLNLFEPYFNNSDMHFGFLAQRLSEGGFLITSRGSNKKEMPLEDIVYVPKVDFANRELYVKYVNSPGKKASLNANTAARIFEELPETNLIVHSHISLGIENKTKTDYSPGTKEDEEEVIKYLGNGKKIAELANHGIIALGSELDEIVNLLDIEPAYRNFPEFYDLIYKRFQDSPEFLELVTKVTDSNENILEMAAGTGDVSKQLFDKGYKNISIADKNSGMLTEAHKKLQRYVKTYITSFEDMNIERKFDSIIIRQAINYLMDYEGLVNGFKNIYEHLNAGGKLIFNAPNYVQNKEYDDRPLQKYEFDGYDVQVKEMNLLEGKILTHTQNCILIKKDGSEIKKVYDLNRFGLFTQQEFESALKEAGFRDTEFLGKGLIEYKPESKTLYCVAKK